MTLIDFMPPRGEVSDLVRIVRGERGRVQHAHGADHPLRLRRQCALGEAHRWTARCWQSAARI
ncbi:MAG: hypothetical protein MZV49_21685 [Rhodopseudomonas palustris]|nr:hypothetical protein [Rhodopseudomonas palustris]